MLRRVVVEFAESHASAPKYIVPKLREHVACCSPDEKKPITPAKDDSSSTKKTDAS